jgi:hypothetical protein
MGMTGRWVFQVISEVFIYQIALFDNGIFAWLAQVKKIAYKRTQRLYQMKMEATL